MSKDYKKDPFESQNFEKSVTAFKKQKLREMAGGKDSVFKDGKKEQKAALVQKHPAAAKALNAKLAKDEALDVGPKKKNISKEKLNSHGVNPAPPRAKRTRGKKKAEAIEKALEKKKYHYKGDDKLVSYKESKLRTSPKYIGGKGDEDMIISRKFLD